MFVCYGCNARPIMGSRNASEIYISEYVVCLAPLVQLVCRTDQEKVLSIDLNIISLKTAEGQSEAERTPGKGA